MIKEESIFVSIASFRDPDCRNTIASLLEKAMYPDRVRIGVLNQIIAGEDSDCIIEPIGTNVVVEELDASLSKGTCWARSRVQALWRDEDYYFQIDSHMRFVERWDEILINMLGECGDGKRVLSTYPLSFFPPDGYGEPMLLKLRPKWFDEEGILLCMSQMSPIPEVQVRPAENHFIAAGMLFTTGDFVREIPYDPYLYHVGEEISLAVRLWTHGWNIYTPNAVIAYHDYHTGDRSKHWRFKADWTRLDRRAKSRVRFLLGADRNADPDVLQEIDKYGIGGLRSLNDYQAAAGVDLRLRMIDGKFALPAACQAASDQQKRLRQQYLAARTRSAQTDQSSWLEKANLPELSHVVKSLGIRTLIDMSSCIAEREGESAKALPSGAPGHRFACCEIDMEHAFFIRVKDLVFVDDIVGAQFPPGDSVLCLDLLNTLPLDVAVEVLNTLTRHYRYLIATTFPEGENIWVSYGKDYRINLQAPPFALPSPVWTMTVGLEGKHLAIWNLQQIA